MFIFGLNQMNLYVCHGVHNLARWLKRFGIRLSFSTFARYYSRLHEKANICLIWNQKLSADSGDQFNNLMASAWENEWVVDGALGEEWTDTHKKEGIPIFYHHFYFQFIVDLLFSRVRHSHPPPNVTRAFSIVHIVSFAVQAVICNMDSIINGAYHLPNTIKPENRYLKRVWTHGFIWNLGRLILTYLYAMWFVIRGWVRTQFWTYKFNFM